MYSIVNVLNHYPNGTPLLIKWEGNVTFAGRIDTIYETDNSLEPDDPEYQEYFACAFYIDQLLPGNKSADLQVGELIELSDKSPIKEICLKSGEKIWQAE